ncbi:MAG: hypothetical protein Q8O89_01560 [Nanoarchaeota archaeon]|nr:hypothetical protein [Nanoarchaeota archaeon]
MMPGQYKHCKYCKERFMLKAKKDWLGRQKPINFMMKTNPTTEEPIFFHLKCWKLYQNAKARDKKYKLSGGINTGVASVKGEIEENQ